jgi:hypothetical protein
MNKDGKYRQNVFINKNIFHTILATQTKYDSEGTCL